MRKYLLFLVIASVSLSNCKKQDDNADNFNVNNIAPNGFNFGTSKSILINIKLLSNLGEPIKGVPVKFCFLNDTTVVFTALTNLDGAINSKLTIPSYVEQMVIRPNYIGFIKEANAFIKDNSLDLTIGGPNGLSGNVILSSATNNQDSKIKTLSNNFIKSLSANFSYLGTYDVNGRPNYLTSKPSAVSAELLGFLNASLPEEKNIIDHHLVYLSPSASRDLDVIKSGEIFVTYVSEGANFQNTMGYYTYPTGKKPSSLDQIQDIKYIFPNTSGLGSRGGLLSGDRVSLGNFNAGTSIGVVLFSNAWDDASKTVNPNKYERFFSDKNLNPENDNNLNLKQHSVFLDYEKEDLVVVGFEDTNRETGKSDNDFNDIVVFFSSSKVNAFNKQNMIKLSEPVDSDGDGISDDLDLFPGDSKKAYSVFFPSQNGWGTLAFEDLWPAKGDYDMNDLVVNYRYSYNVNANNEVVDMKADYKVNQSLAFYKNGFGVELPINQNVIDDVRGYINSGKYIKYNQNGTEAGQAKAVIIPFDNQKLIFDNNVNYSEPIRVIIAFLKPQPISILNAAPYNPFLISDGRRSYEIHLPGFPPTSLADKNLFGSLQDLSNPAIGKYYIGENNWPWALSFVEPFNYPTEGKPVNLAYPNFSAWAASGGTQFKDWYKQ
ncbi:hypothetical protein A5893_12385 [Pedobacter psychrophilus]|uniref:DUF4842 domain-containing protein n=1 Tax=Pedobacter psychrophilus TaxID=1826909 RepID=A0A179DCR0_9SPHI|nr:LruC domain-containing protein [Pedobacter psychrophilus]OAQ38836.1 hypothetical protein A5893_12385 [Pedobacter psychrophilus]